jgi:AraC family transcriptional regulator of adaptative response/methylated-DNA-[protein]-cysteine methyltransferase
MVRACIISTPLNDMLAVADEQAVLLLQFVEDGQLSLQMDQIHNIFGCNISSEKNKILDLLQQELAAYFLGTLKNFTVPIVLQGTQFQIQVWQTLQTIPYGGVQSYQQVAHAIKNTQAVRAVGNANGANRCVIIIPCHRVIQAGGKSGGYAGGIERKRWLLDHEQRYWL